MYEKIELIISEYKLNIITKEKCLIELRNHIEQIIKQVDTKQLTLTDVVKSSLDLKFINLLDGELCDYKVINKICNRQDDAQDVLRKVHVRPWPT